jgi:hypothetical protein
MCWVRGSVATEGCLWGTQQRHDLGVPCHHSRLQRHAHLLTHLLFSEEARGKSVGEDGYCYIRAVYPDEQTWAVNWL